MRRIRSKDTKPELVVRRLLRKMDLRYVLHDKRLPGSPDVVFPGLKTVIQVRGCFWHGHTCIDGHVPKSRRSYWGPKLRGNMQRDRRNDRQIRQLGWRLLIVWECRTTPSRLPRLRRRLGRFLGLESAKRPP
jgi:DNA mismatch endonuclease, patch repair protein